MNDQEIKGLIGELLGSAEYGDSLDETEAAEVLQEQVSSVADFQDVGMMSSDAGLVVRMEDGSEFQITVKQSR